MHTTTSPKISGARAFLVGCAAACLLGSLVCASAQQPVVPPSAIERLTAAPLAGLIDIQADNLSYDAARRLVIARGNVIVKRGTDSVVADYAEIDTATEQVTARGNLKIEYMGNTWEGEEAIYNFKTGVGDFGAFELFSPPYYVTA